MKIIVMFSFLIIFLTSFNVWAQNQTLRLPEIPRQAVSPNNKKVNTTSTIQLAVSYDYMIPSYKGKRFHDTSIEARGWNTISVIDLYWSWKFSNFMRTSVLSNLDKSAKNYQYGVIAPRLSLDKIVGTSLSFLIFKEFFISYRFEFDSPDAKGSNLLKHNLGIGVDFSIPMFDRLKTNIYARYTEKNYGRNNYSWNGYLFTVDYLITFYRFQSGIGFQYEGWLEVVFGAKANNNSDPRWTSESVLWKNTFKIDYKGFAIGYTYQFNKNLNEIKYKDYDTSQQAVSLSYSISF